MPSEISEIAEGLKQQVNNEMSQWTKRSTDPDSSTTGLAKAKSRISLLRTIVTKLYGEGAIFTDQDLTIRLEILTGRRQQRNIVARTRKGLEDEGLITRLPRSGKRELLRFTLRVDDQIPGQQRLS